MEFDTDTCLIRAPREGFRNGVWSRGVPEWPQVGTGSPVAVTRFVHVDSCDRTVLDEEEYKGN